MKLLWSLLFLPCVVTYFTSNKTELLALAELASNAYHSPDEKDSWRNTTGVYNYLNSFGYSKDGLRTHLFSHNFRDTLVISIKGTSLSSTNDKENDNNMFSCCCGFTCKERTCDRQRLVTTLPTLYVGLVLETYRIVKEIYPSKEILFTGHSLGASIASIAGMQTCRQVVAFSSPPEALFSERIGLEHNCQGEHTKNIFHFGYEHDPIFLGTCGFLCKVAGYNMDSKCHHGNKCVYSDLVDLGSTLITRHTINYLIDIIKRSEPPTCTFIEDCQESCS